MGVITHPPVSDCFFGFIRVKGFIAHLPSFRVLGLKYVSLIWGSGHRSPPSPLLDFGFVKCVLWPHAQACIECRNYCTQHTLRSFAAAPLSCSTAEALTDQGLRAEQIIEAPQLAPLDPIHLYICEVGGDPIEYL